MNLELRFGRPDSYDFDTIIDQFSGTKINSFRTSSVPLVQFWKNTNNRLNDLFNKLDLHCDKPTLCFEYPTKLKQGKGKSSMTDLMILGNDFKIAVEGKFTEYVKNKPDLIKKWKLDGDKENRIKVLNYWSSLIKPFSNGYDNEALNQISYQFYHRTASACDDNKGQAIVVYQVFYDNDTLGFLKHYKSELTKYVSILNPNNKLSFYIWEIEANQLITDSNNFDPFVEMKSRNIYEFAKTRFEKL